MQNHYEALGVTPDATSAEIAAAAVALLKIFEHHSTGSSGAVVASRVKEALEVLSDPASRREFDRELKAAAKPRFQRPAVRIPEPTQGGESVHEPHNDREPETGERGPTFRGIILQHLWRWARGHRRLTASGLGAILILLLMCGHAVAFPAHPAAGVSDSGGSNSASAPTSGVKPGAAPPTAHVVVVSAAQRARVDAWSAATHPPTATDVRKDSTAAVVLSGTSTVSSATPTCVVVQLTSVTAWAGEATPTTSQNRYSLFFSPDDVILFSKHVDEGWGEHGCEPTVQLTAHDAVTQ